MIYIIGFILLWFVGGYLGYGLWVYNFYHTYKCLYQPEQHFLEFSSLWYGNTFDDKWNYIVAYRKNFDKDFVVNLMCGWISFFGGLIKHKTKGFMFKLPPLPDKESFRSYVISKTPKL